MGPEDFPIERLRNLEADLHHEGAQHHMDARLQRQHGNTGSAGFFEAAIAYLIAARMVNETMMMVIADLDRKAASEQSSDHGQPVPCDEAGGSRSRVTPGGGDGEG